MSASLGFRRRGLTFSKQVRVVILGLLRYIYSRVVRIYAMLLYAISIVCSAQTGQLVEVNRV
jgi:hypothetical protein